MVLARARGPRLRWGLSLVLFALITLGEVHQEYHRSIRQAVVSLQRSRRTDVLNACDTLTALANHGHQAREAILLYKEGEALLEVLSAITDFGGDAEVLASACSLIAILSIGIEARIVFAELGAVDLIVSVLKTHPDNAAVLEHACDALINLAIDRRISVHFGSAGGVRAVLQALAFATVGNSEVESHKPRQGWRVHDGVLKSSLLALANLAAASPNADLIGEEGGVEMAVEAVNFAFEDSRRMAAEVPLDTLVHAVELLRNLAFSPSNRLRIVESGGVELVAGAIRTHQAASSSPAPSRTHQAAQTGTRNHAADEEATKGGTSIPSLEAAGPRSILEAGLHLLAKLTADPETRHAVLDAETMQLGPSTLADFARHPSVLASACRMVSSLLRALDDHHERADPRTTLSRRQAAALERALLAGNVLERAAMTVDMHAAHEGVGLYCRKVCESLTERARARWSGDEEVHPVVPLLHELRAGGKGGGQGVVLEMSCRALTDVVDGLGEELALNVSSALLERMGALAQHGRAMHACCLSLWQMGLCQHGSMALQASNAALVLVRLVERHSADNEVLDSCLRALVPLVEEDAGARRQVREGATVAVLQRAVLQGVPMQDSGGGGGEGGEGGVGEEEDEAGVGGKASREEEEDEDGQARTRAEMSIGTEYTDLVQDLDVQEQISRLVAAAVMDDGDAWHAVEHGALNLLLVIAGNRGGLDGRVKLHASLTLADIIRRLPDPLPHAHSYSARESCWTDAVGSGSVAPACTDRKGAGMLGTVLVLLSGSVGMHKHELPVLKVMAQTLMAQTMRSRALLGGLDEQTVEHVATQLGAALQWLLSVHAHRDDLAPVWAALAALLRTLSMLASRQTPGGPGAMLLDAAGAVDASHKALALAATPGVCVGSARAVHAEGKTGGGGGGALRYQLPGDDGRLDAGAGMRGAKRRQDGEESACARGRQVVVEAACSALWALGASNQGAYGRSHTQKCFWACAPSGDSACAEVRSGRTEVRTGRVRAREQKTGSEASVTRDKDGWASSADAGRGEHGEDGEQVGRGARGWASEGRGGRGLLGEAGSGGRGSDEEVEALGENSFEALGEEARDSGVCRSGEMPYGVLCWVKLHVAAPYALGRLVLEVLWSLTLPVCPFPLHDDLVLWREDGEPLDVRRVEVVNGDASHPPRIELDSMSPAYVARLGWPLDVGALSQAAMSSAAQALVRLLGKEEAACLLMSPTAYRLSHLWVGGISQLWVGSACADREAATSASCAAQANSFVLVLLTAAIVAGCGLALLLLCTAAALLAHAALHLRRRWSAQQPVVVQARVGDGGRVGAWVGARREEVAEDGSAVAEREDEVPRGVGGTGKAGDGPVRRNRRGRRAGKGRGKEDIVHAEDVGRDGGMDRRAQGAAQEEEREAQRSRTGEEDGVGGCGEDGEAMRAGGCGRGMRRQRVCILFADELARATLNFAEERRIGSGSSGDVFLADRIAGFGDAALVVKRMRDSEAGGADGGGGGAGAAAGPDVGRSVREEALRASRNERKAHFLQEVLVLGEGLHLFRV
jgi:hypothetical protein